MSEKLSLHWSPKSPYVRKVMICAIERGVDHRIERLSAAASPIARDATIVAHNPSGKVPTALLPDGTALFDSRIICQYVDEMGGGGILYPQGAQRYPVLTLEALADGLLDAALLLRYETMMRPEDLRWPEWIAGQSEKIDSSLAALAEPFLPILKAGFHAGAIATACALGYLDFRFSSRDWRGTHPELAEWYLGVAERPSLLRTAPPA